MKRCAEPCALQLYQTSLNKFCVIFHFLPLFVFMSIQNIGRSIALTSLTWYWITKTLLNDQSITSPHNEPQTSPGFVQKQPLALFCKKGVFKNFANFTVKHLCWSLFLITLQFLKPATLLKRYSNTDVFLWNLWNFQENLYWWKPENNYFFLFHLKIL